MAAGSRAAHADEQPRSRRRRATGRSRGLRRHRDGGAQLGGVRRDRRRAARARERRDAARAERQAGRGVSHARVGAARADREQESRRPLGDLGSLPRARAARPDDVRPDDRGLVDLHRLAGHRAGHVRDVRRRRATALRRIARRPARRHGGTRRHGRRAAARRDDAGRGDPRHRRRRVAHRQAPRDGLLRRKAASLDEALALVEAARREATRAVGRRRGERGARAPGARRAAACAPTCSPIRRARTTC